MVSDPEKENQNSGKKKNVQRRKKKTQNLQISLTMATLKSKEPRTASSLQGHNDREEWFVGHKLD